jgi:RHS repeat-associated protein
MEYGYDALGRLATVKDWKQSGANISTNFYDLAGVLTETSYPNTIRQRFEHTEQNRLSKVIWEQNTGSAMVARKRLAYQLNATGQRVQVDEDNGAPAVSRTVKYAYDTSLNPPIVGMGATATTSGGINLPFYQRIPKLGRLTQESVIYPNTAAKNADYTYDLVGNRLTRANATAIDSALANQALMYDSKDRFTQSGAPTSFDANGNTVTSAAGTISDYYDAENQLIKRTAPNTVTIRIVYDHEGNRACKQVQTGSAYVNTHYLVDDKNPTGYAQVLLETRDTGATPSANNATFYIAYVYGQNLISIRNNTPTTYYYGYDGQGSVRALFTSTGTIAKTYNYDAWGNWLSPSTQPIDNCYLYTAQQWDPDLGLFYLRARYYAPQYGRFWTMDSYEGNPSNPVSLHKYLYCSADPANRSDPSGWNDLSAPGVTVNSGIMGVTSSQVGSAIARANLSLAKCLLWSQSNPAWTDLILYLGVPAATWAVSQVAEGALYGSAKILEKTADYLDHHNGSVPQGWASYGRYVEDYVGTAIVAGGGRAVNGNVSRMDGLYELSQSGDDVLFQVKAVNLAPGPNYAERFASASH